MIYYNIIVLDIIFIYFRLMIGSVYAYVLIILIPLFFSIKDGALIECDLIHLVKVRKLKKYFLQ